MKEKVLNYCITTKKIKKQASNTHLKKAIKFEDQYAQAIIVLLNK